MDSFGTRTTFQIDGAPVDMCSLPALERAGFSRVSRLPYSLKILLENLLRGEDGGAVNADDIQTLARWDPAAATRTEIAFRPARVLLQDFTGVPAIVDLAAMRDGIVRLGGDPSRVNPLQPAELVIDHSVQVDHFGRPDAVGLNAELEFSRNRERYAFLRWGQNAFENFSVVPPDTGIVHQVNLEYLARVVCCDETDGRSLAYPDTLVGTDSHTTMINGLGVVGWGVGGIEVEAAMLGQPISMLIPVVVGVRLVGELPGGATATDLVLTVTERLRGHGVVEKFVEFFGTGLANLTLADRATLGNMSPEYGSTVAMFPVDAMTLDYLRLSGRDEAHVNLVERYTKDQGLFRSDDVDPEYASTLEVDLTAVEPSLAGPRRPQDRVTLSGAKAAFAVALPTLRGGTGEEAAVAEASPSSEPGHGAVVVAAITSCTNTSNPSVMMGAGLLAKKAVARGLTSRPWVKTSLAPGSKVVTAYLEEAGLLEPLAQLGFDVVGYGCTTCIGNSGPLLPDVTQRINDRGLVVAAVLSGNRNFEGRIHPLVRANYLASPPLVVAYALAGSMTIDLTSEPLDHDPSGTAVFLRDLWPSRLEIQDAMGVVTDEMFKTEYATVFEGDDRWRSLEVPVGDGFEWDAESTYIRHPPFFEDMDRNPRPVEDVRGARVLAVLGDSITTDHISPAGAIPADGPAGRYLVDHGVSPSDFNSFGARRGNHEVMVRGTFANIRLRNLLAPGTEGGWTTFLPDGGVVSIYDAAVRYREAGVPLVVLAGKEYGSGSSRDWAAKGTKLLGVRAVVAQSYERIHRSNLVNMGVLPLQFKDGEGAAELGLSGQETFEIAGLDDLLPGADLEVTTYGSEDKASTFQVTIRIDTPEELSAFKHGGILPYVLRQLLDGGA